MANPRSQVGLVSATCMVVASMIGAGVFTTSGFSLGDLKSPEWVLLAWLVGSVVAICGAISYGALAKGLSESGGEYLYLSRLVHPLVGFLAGWISLTAGFTGAIAFVAGVFGQYAAPLLAPLSIAPETLAIAAIVFCTVQHLIGLHAGIGAQNTLVLLKLALLAVIVLVGCATLASRGLPVSDTIATPTLAAFANTLTWIALAYTGFNAAIYVAGEIREPDRNVPRAMLIGTVIVVVFYLLLNAIFVYAGPIERLAGRPDIAAVATELLGGEWLGRLCRVTICVATLSSVSANLLAGPRVYDRMAADGLFPLRWSGTGRVPRLAIVLQAVLAAVLVYATTLREQLDYLGMLLSLSAAVTAATVLVLPVGLPTRMAATLFVAASLLFAGLTAVRTANEKGAVVGIAVGATLLLGVVLYFVMRGIHHRGTESTEED